MPSRPLGVTEWFQFLLAHAPTPAMLIQGQKILEVNAALTSLLGFSRSELLADSALCDLLSAPACAALRSYSEQRDADSQLYNQPVCVSAAGGEELWVNLEAWANEVDGEQYIMLRLHPEGESGVEQQLRRVLRAMRVLQRINHTLVHITEEQPLLQETCRICVYDAGYKMAWIGYALHDNLKTIQPQAHAGLDDAYFRSLRFSWVDDDPHYGKGPTGTAVRTRATCVMYDLQHNPLYLPWSEAARQRGYNSAVSIPLLLDHGAVGALNICAAELDAFDTDELALLEELALDLTYGIRSIREAKQRQAAEEELRSATEFLAGLMDNAPMPIYALSREGRLAVVNKSWRELFEYKSMLSAGSRLEDLVGAESAVHFTRLSEQVFALGKPLKLEVSLTLAGQAKNFIVFGFPLRGADGTTTASGGICLDVTEQRQIEQTLRFNEQALRDAERIAGLGNWVLDMRTGVAVWSENMAQVMGVDARDPRVRTVEYFRDHIVHPEDRDRVLHELNAAFEGTAKYDTEYKIIDQQQQIRQIAARAVMLHDGRGQPVRMVGTVQDVTQRKEAESQLMQLNAELAAINEELRITNEELAQALDAAADNAERFRTVFDQTPAGIYRTTPDGKILLANPALVAMLGYESLEALLRRNLSLEGYVDPVKRANFKTQVLQPGGLRNFESQWVRADGSLISVSETATACLDAAGNVLYYDGFVQDMTARLQAVQALRESEERYRAIFEQSPDGIALVQNERIVFANPAMLALHGAATPEQILGRPVLDFVPAEDHELVRAQLAHPPRPGDISQLIEGRLQRLDGSIADVELRQSLSNWQGLPSLQIICRDVSERKKLEQQLQQMQKLEAVGVLAGGIAHDFNNILFGILGYADMVQDELQPGSEAYQNQEQVIQAGMRAKDLVQQILAFSRQSEHVRVPVSVGRIVKEAMKLMRASLPATISITQRIGDGTEFVLADPIELHQVVMNLCTNSGHAMPQGGTLEVEVRTLHVDEDFAALHQGLQPGLHVLLSVVDSGTGMSPDILGKIFDPFFTTKLPGEGTGLGLSVVYGIVQALGGAVTVYSELGKGSAFNLYFPAVGKAVTEPGEDTLDRKLLRGTEHILVVDDEESLMQLAQRILTRLGYTVTAFCDSMEALTALREHPDRFDMLLTDQTMPGLTGMSLARAALKLRPSLPVIIVTGFTHSTLEDEALFAGVSAVATKPLVADTLGALVRRVLDGQK